MFNLPQVMLDYWTRKSKPKATTADIAVVEAAIGAELALPYVEFVTQFGFVLFSSVPGMRNEFDYALRYPDRMEVQSGDIAYMLDPQMLVRAYNHDTKLDVPEEGLPCYPPDYLVVAGSAGQDSVLLQIHGDHPGRVWYWPENEDAWGRGTNTVLGFVAENFYDFINRLRPWEDA
jgi:hypothetical protein